MKVYIQNVREQLTTNKKEGNKMTTTSCKAMYDAMGELHEELIEMKNTKLEKMLVKIEDAFCDFECAWNEHANKYHGGLEAKKVMKNIAAKK